MGTVIGLVVLVALGVWAYKWLKSRPTSGSAKNLTKQAQEAVAGRKDRIHDAVDAMSVAANEKTHGKYAAQIAKVGQKASEAVEKLAGEAGADETAAAAPGAPRSSGAADAQATEPPATGPSFGGVPSFAGGPSFTDAPATEPPAAGPSFADGPSFTSGPSLTDAPATEPPVAGPSFGGGPSFTDAAATGAPAAAPNPADAPVSAAPSGRPTFDE